jgi:hypothetical protein
MATNESMQNVMNGIAKILSGANSKMNTQSLQDTVKRFMNEKERMNVLNEYMEDAMNMDGDEIEDEDADNLIKEMSQKEEVKKKQKEEEKRQEELNEFEDGLKDL